MKSLSDFQGLINSHLSVDELLKISRLFETFDRTLDGQIEHSNILDKLFGYNIPAIEFALHSKARELFPGGNVQTWGNSLHEGNQTWVGLDPQTLQTPYDEFHQMFDYLKPKNNIVVDLGAGYGRIGLVLHQMAPDCTFLGYELLPERVDEGNRILKQVSQFKGMLTQQNLMAPKFRIPLAEIYFLYDFGNVGHIRHILNQLSALADNHKFKVIARGKGVRSLIDHEYPWLSQVYQPFHQPNFSIYFMS